MRIAVCMKQVPASGAAQMDKNTGMLIRSNSVAVINPYDLPALETALRLKDSIGVFVSVFTMGPRGAESLLHEAFAMGADEGFHITGREFAGADTVATSYTLAEAIKSKGQFDMIICGMRTTDGDTSQVSGSIAAFLGYPQINRVTELVKISEDSIIVKARTENKALLAQLKLPCLISVEKDICVPRIPGLASRLTGRKKCAQIISLDSLRDSDDSHYGSKGSATRVVKLFSPPECERRDIVTLEGQEAAAYILNIMKSSDTAFIKRAGI